MKNDLIDIDGELHMVLTQDKLCHIDMSDMKLLGKYRWCAAKNGIEHYAITSIKKDDNTWTTLPMHKLLMKTPQGMQVDHINHDGLNNTRENLRIVTQSQNNMNSRKQKNTSSQFKGCYWNKSAQKWLVQIKIDGKSKHLGYFTSEQEAANAYNRAAKELFGEYSSNYL